MRTLAARLSLAVFALGLVAVALAAIGPSLGLGANEAFIAYRLFGLSRSRAAELGMAAILLAIAPTSILLFWKAIRWHRSKAMNLRIVRWIVVEAIPAVAIAALTTMACFGGAEIYFRWSEPFIANEWPMHFDPAVGVTSKPGATVRLTNHVDFWATTKVNSLGFLDREPRREKLPGTCRIAFLGDSFVEAAQVPIEQKLQVQLERLLEQRIPGKRFDTVAFGYSGTGQINQLPFYDVFARPLKPDVVVLVVVSNDFANNSAVLEGVRNSWHPDHSMRQFGRLVDGASRMELIPVDPAWGSHPLPAASDMSAPTALQRANQILRSASYFYNWTFMNISTQYPNAVRAFAGPSVTSVHADNMRLIERLPGYEGAFDGWRYPEDLDLDVMFYADKMPTVFNDALTLTDLTLGLYLSRGERDGFSVVILATTTLSQRYKDGASAFGRKMIDRGYLQRIRDLASKRGIPVVDQYDYIVARGGDPDSVRFRRDGHWSPQGHRWAAEALADYIQANPAICGK